MTSALESCYTPSVERARARIPNRHELHRQYAKDPGTVERFFALCSPKDAGDCITFHGAGTRSMSGRFALRPGFFISAHRFAYLIAYPDFPKHAGILHRCTNPRCVNIEHLALDDRRDRTPDPEKMAANAATL